tara:strand:+ start:234 stop:902 length:669 start_codon:yes stop_codon:yes gene_type:complete
MTAKIKLNAASGGGSISIQAPSSSSNNRVIALPDIADGTLVTSESTLDATKLSGALPAISGASLTGISSGLSMVDVWAITSGYTVSSGTNDITANWARSNATHGVIGSAMTESSGIFTFPSTGIYHLVLTGLYYHNAVLAYPGFAIAYTTDNSNYVGVGSGHITMGASSGGNYVSPYISAIVDITNTSTHKVKFQTAGDGGALQVVSTNRALNVEFKRLGDT